VLGLAAVTGFTSAGNALAYGSADQPLAQVEISANCNNPDVPLCQGFGLGGIWFWAEIDANGTADVAGTSCSHTQPGGGGSTFSLRGEYEWMPLTSADLGSLPPTVFVAGSDPGGQYYYLPDLGFVVPQTDGHYLREARARSHRAGAGRAVGRALSAKAAAGTV
jgi:hypothetical protein